MSTHVEFLVSDFIIEPVESKRNFFTEGSLNREPGSKSVKVESITSGNVSNYSDQSEIFQCEFDSDTVISVSNSHIDQLDLTNNSSRNSGITQTMVEDTCMSDAAKCRQNSYSDRSRLEQITERLFAAVSPVGDIKINHLACMAHIRDRLCSVCPNCKILVFNCQNPDPDINTIFERVEDCCFDLCSKPDLASFIGFCEITYDWLALASEHIVLFHAESPAALQRMLLLLYAFSCFSESVERQDPCANKRIKAYLSRYPNSVINVPVVYLRYASYMSIFTPFRRLTITRASMAVHCLAMFNCPLFTESRVRVFFKFYSYAPLRHVFTTAVHTLNGRHNNQLVIQFCESAIILKGDVVIVCYRCRDSNIGRQRLFKLTFHSCQAYREFLTFNYDAFDEISEGTPATFNLDLHLIKGPDVNTRRENCYVEHTRQSQSDDQTSFQQNRNPLDIMHSSNASVKEIRLADSLEDLPTHNIGLPQTSAYAPNLQKFRTLSFGQQVKQMPHRFGDWRFDHQLVKSRLLTAIAGVPPRPPPPKLLFLGVKESALDRSIKYHPNDDDKGSVTSENSMQSRKSDPCHNEVSCILKSQQRESKLMPPPRATLVPRRPAKGPPPRRIDRHTVTASFTASKNVAFCSPRPHIADSSLMEIEDTGEIYEDMDMQFDRKTKAGVRSVPTQFFGPPEKARRIGNNSNHIISDKFLLPKERSTPTIIEEEVEDYLEAEERQRAVHGYQFDESQTNMSTTKDLDQLLDELRRTSLDYSTGRPPMNGHRTFGHSSRPDNSNFMGSGATTSKYITRSSSTSGAGYNRGHPFEDNGSKCSNSATSFQRQTAYSSERQQYGTGVRPQFDRNNSYGYSTVNYGGGDSVLPIQDKITNSVSMRASSPAPKYQTIFKTTLHHRPPSSPKRFNQVNVTIDPDNCSNHSSLFGESRYQTTPITNSRYHTNSVSAVDSSSASYREQKLLEELSIAQRELEMLQRSSSAMDEPLRPPATLPIQRRAFQQQQESNHQQTMFTNRHRTSYQSNHDIHQGSSLLRPQSRFDLQNSGFHTSTGLPKRAMSSANVANTQTWNYRNGNSSAAHSPTSGFQTMRSSFGGSRLGTKVGIGEGYSARRERLRSEAEQQEQMRQSQYLRQSNARINQQVASSSNDLRMQQQRRQHYHSMSTIQPERAETFEETITLQPIGRGVQDLDSNMGSINNLNRPRQATASSMLEGLNRLDKYNNHHPVAPRNNFGNFGRQNSAINVSNQVNTNQNASTSYLSQRRLSGSVMSETTGMTVDNRSQLNKNCNSGSLTGTTFRTKPNNVGIQPQAQQQLQSQKTWPQTNDHVVPQGLIYLSHVQETAPSWYRLKISRQEAISLLKHEPPGSFLVRDSTTFKDAYGLAVKSTKPPPKSTPKSGFAKFMKNILNDLDSDLVRHYLIESVTTPTRGVRIKGFSMEPVFPSLVALIYHHTQQPLALPCTLRLPPILVHPHSGLPGPVLSVAGDSDSNTIVQMDTIVNVNGGMAVESTPQISNGQFLSKPIPARSSITSPLSPTAGLFTSDLTSPSPSFSCRCLYMGAVEVATASESAGLTQAVDRLIHVDVSVMLATSCDQMGDNAPFQYTECQLQVAANEGILLTDLSRKIFFQRHFSGNSFVFAGIDPRDKMFIHPNHSALGFEKPRIFGFIIKKLSGEFMCHVFSEFDANHSANEIVAQINAILSNK